MLHIDPEINDISEPLLSEHPNDCKCNLCIIYNTPNPFIYYCQRVYIFFSNIFFNRNKIF